MKRFKAAALLFCLALCCALTACSGTRRIYKSDLAVCLPELVEQSKVLNEIYFGDGFPPRGDATLPGNGYYYVDGEVYGFESIEQIKEATEQVFTPEYSVILYAAAFDGVLQAIKKAGYETGTPHICNSAGLLRFPDLAMGGVRIGSAILGRLSFKGSYGLKRVGVCEAAIGEIRWLPKGHTCGYGAAWKAKHPTRIAIVPVGWYHGFGCEMGHDVFRTRDQLRAALSALAGIFRRKAYYVMLGTQRCKVLGHIGMLHTVIDVTKVKCALGDRVQMNINPLMLKGMDVVFR